jgi:hypothetical protein
MAYYSSFVVKIWVGDQRQMIRGYVRHVGTQKSMYFLTPDAMVSFMMNNLNSTADHMDWSERAMESTNSAQDK